MRISYKICVIFLSLVGKLLLGFCVQPSLFSTHACFWTLIIALCFGNFCPSANLLPTSFCVTTWVKPSPFCTAACIFAYLCTNLSACFWLLDFAWTLPVPLLWLLIFEFPFWLFCCQLGVLPDCFKRIKEHLNCPAAPESAFEFTIFTWPHRPWHVVLHFF